MQMLASVLKVHGSEMKTLCPIQLLFFLWCANDDPVISQVFFITVKFAALDLR